MEILYCETFQQPENVLFEDVTFADSVSHQSHQLTFDQVAFIQPYS